MFDLNWTLELSTASRLLYAAVPGTAQLYQPVVVKAQISAVEGAASSEEVATNTPAPTQISASSGSGGCRINSRSPGRGSWLLLLGACALIWLRWRLARRALPLAAPPASRRQAR